MKTTACGAGIPLYNISGKLYQRVSALCESGYCRAVVYAVISIQRMKFLVRRWHTGMRKYEKINARHYQRSKERFLQENPGTAANFQVGQPVSNQYFPHSPYQVSL